MKSLEYLSKEDPLNYFAEPVDASVVPGYRDVVRWKTDHRAGFARLDSLRLISSLVFPLEVTTRLVTSHIRSIT